MCNSGRPSRLGLPLDLYTHRMLPPLLLSASVPTSCASGTRPCLRKVGCAPGNPLVTCPRSSGVWSVEDSDVFARGLSCRSHSDLAVKVSMIYWIFLAPGRRDRSPIRDGRCDSLNGLTTRLATSTANPRNVSATHATEVRCGRRLARDGAVQNQMDASVEDGVERTRRRLLHGESLLECEECGAEMGSGFAGVKPRLRWACGAALMRQGLGGRVRRVNAPAQDQEQLRDESQSGHPPILSVRSAGGGGDEDNRAQPSYLGQNSESSLAWRLNHPMIERTPPIWQGGIIHGTTVFHWCCPTCFRGTGTTNILVLTYSFSIN